MLRDEPVDPAMGSVNAMTLRLFEHCATPPLSNAAWAAALFGYPTVPLHRLLDATAGWLPAGGAVHGKDTHSQERGGRY